MRRRRLHLLSQERTAGILASRSLLLVDFLCCSYCFWLAASLFGLRFGGFVVVLFVVDLFAVFVLLFVDLLFLLGGQGAAVGGALVVNLLSGFGLVGIGLGGFAGGHLTAA